LSQTPTIYTVDQINRYVKRTIESDTLLKDVWIRGEISNYTNHSSGHMYFSIKENGSVIKAVMFAGQNKNLKFKPQNGTKVLVRANVTVYEPSGQYQVNVKEMQPDGIGNLYLAFEQLKEKLEKEGLFEPSRKRDIPKFPKVIGLVTSPTGAAIQDMITTIQRRYPVAKIQLFPVLVQGDTASKSIINGIEKMNLKGDADVLIVGRGGGSIEDLWSFNDEGVARAIFESKIPVISAVGHETDFTIADFVSDMRAPTPTAAAELATSFTLHEIKKTMSRYEEDLKRILGTKVAMLNERLRQQHKILDFYHPQKQLNDAFQKLDSLSEKMSSVMKAKTKENRTFLEHLDHRMQLNSPKKQIKQSKEQLMNISDLLSLKMKHLLKQKENEMAIAISKLDSLSPLKTLSRGYSVAYKDGNVLKESSQIKTKDEITIKITNAKVTCTVNKIEEE